MKNSELSRCGRCVAVGVVALVVALRVESARAATVIAGDLDYANPIDSSAPSGAGFGIRVGQQLRLRPIITVTPEMAFTFHDFSTGGPLAYRGLLGLRLGFGEILRPGVFGHLGVGRLIPEDPARSTTAFSYDAGAFLDFTLLPILDLGAHAAYIGVNAPDAEPGLGWVTLGVHVALVF